MINYIKQYLGSIIATSFFLCATYFSIYDNSQNSKINNQMSLNQYTVFAEQNIKNEAPSGISSISAIKEKSEYMKIKTDLLKKADASASVAVNEQQAFLLNAEDTEPVQSSLGEKIAIADTFSQQEDTMSLFAASNPQAESSSESVSREDVPVSRGSAPEEERQISPQSQPPVQADESSASTAVQKVQLIPWFGEGENIFSIGTVATVIDVDTGVSFKVQRTYGYNHADVETLTLEDTDKLKAIAGGSWNWIRRAIILEIGEYRIAASIAPMPHAGRDDMPANIYVSDRSQGYGYGANLDTIKGNGIDGHMDIHLYGSRTHSSNSVNSDHQAMIQKAYNSDK